jgi:hypothetical protein
LALSNNLANRATNCEIRRIGGLLIASAGHTKMVVQTMLELDSVAVISETTLMATSCLSRWAIAKKMELWND